MYPRLSFDICWSDLIWVAGRCLWSSDITPAPPGEGASTEAIYTLSVRSSFDLLLSALDLPPGCEVLISEVTVPHMETILKEHQLVPIAVPVDPQTLQISSDEIKARVTDKSRLLIVAHLFGTRMPLDDLGKLCQTHGLILIEDSAQALIGSDLSRDSCADVSMFSFGPIKTATALGGGVVLIKDDSLRERMQQIAGDWPLQSTTSYMGRVAKIAWLKVLSLPAFFSLLVWLINHTLGDSDAFVGHSARGFPDDQLFAALRQQPCRPLKQLIDRRLQLFDESLIAKRTQRGWHVIERLVGKMRVAGADNSTHTFWVFPLICPEPTETVSRLRAAGFDASQISGLTVIGGAPADHWFARTVFVPIGLTIPQQSIDKMLQVLRNV